MIKRSEFGPRCPHCGDVNPASMFASIGIGEHPIFGEHQRGHSECIHCGGKFAWWIEKLPFYCTDNGRPARCDCGVCTGKAAPPEQAET